MKIESIESYRDNFTDDGFGKLSTSLDRIRSGNNNVLLTPQAKRVGATKILEEWDKVFRSNVKEVNKDLLELENSNRAKFGPRSIAKPWLDIRQSVLDGFDIPTVNCEHSRS